MTTDTRPQEVPEHMYDALMLALENLRRWMTENGFNESEVDQWMNLVRSDADGDARMWLRSSGSR